MELKINKTEFDKFFRRLIRDWLSVRDFTGEFKVTYPKTTKGSVKIELYYDDNNTKEAVKRLSKELCK